MKDGGAHVGDESERRGERSEPLPGAVDLPLMWGRAATADRDRAPIESEEARELPTEKHIGESQVISFAPGFGHAISDAREGGAPDLVSRAFTEPGGAGPNISTSSSV